MQIAANFDASAATAPSWFESTVNYVVQQFDALFTSPITISINFGWGEVGNAAIGGANAASSQSEGTFLDYSTLKNAMTAHADTTVSQTAAATLPAADPTNGGQFFVPNAMQQNLGLMPSNTGSVDGYVGLNAQENWNTQPGSPMSPGQYDPVGALEHEITEIMGRIGLAGFADGAGNYAPMDLFHYSSPGHLDLKPETASFSPDGQHLLTSFNNPQQGGDVADWAPSVVGDAFGSSVAGLRSALTSTDLAVMHALGYDTSADATTIASVPQQPAAITDVAFHGPRAATLTGTGTQDGATVDVYAGKHLLGTTTVDQSGNWSLDAVLGKGLVRPLSMVETNANGSTETAKAQFTLQTGITHQPFVTRQQTFGTDGSLIGQRMIAADGSTYLESNVTAESNGDKVFDYYGGTFFGDKGYSDLVGLVDASGKTLNQVTFSPSGPSARSAASSTTQPCQFQLDSSHTTLMFTENPGQAILSGFQATGDQHEVIALPPSAFTSAADVLRHTHTQDGSAVIDLSPGNSITIAGITAATLEQHPTDFSLAG